MLESELTGQVYPILAEPGENSLTIIGITDTSGGSCNTVLGKSPIVDNTDVLLGFNRWLQHCCFELIVTVL